MNEHQFPLCCSIILGRNLCAIAIIKSLYHLKYMIVILLAAKHTRKKKINENFKPNKTRNTHSV